MGPSLAEKHLECITHFLEALLRSLHLLGSATHEALSLLENLLFDLL